MKLGILLSGGKDSLYAAYLASKDHKLACSITIQSENKESYMFHTPNINLVGIQSEAMGIPLILRTTKGVKEQELEDLKSAIIEAKEKYDIEGIVTGAVASQYQAQRVQEICHELDLWCFNPLWQVDQVQLLRDLLENEFETKIIGVYGYPLDERFLGKTIDEKTIEELERMQEEYKINPAGEGGETESLVVDCPLFNKKIQIQKSEQEWENYAGTYTVLEAELVDKSKNTARPKEYNLEKNKEINNAKNKDVLIINTVSKKLPILHYEFIRPIVDVLEEMNKTYLVIHINDVQKELLQEKNTSKIIISGTALKDNEFLEHKTKLEYLNRKTKVLGICAGAELLGFVAGAELKEVFEIGQVEIQKEKEKNIFSRVKSIEFFLHQYGFDKNDEKLDVYLTTEKGVAGFVVPESEWVGIQFHPELREKSILKEFLEE